MHYKLVELSINDEYEIYDMLQELPAEENGYQNSMYGKSYDEFKEWLISSERIRQGIGLENWMVPQSTYYLFANEKPVGIAKIRHHLTDALRQAGGHAGYSIRPSERNKGYGTILLELLIQEMKQLKIDRILLTIQNQNHASIKVALKNGGVIEEENDIRKYIWINT